MAVWAKVAGSEPATLAAAGGKGDRTLWPAAAVAVRPGTFLGLGTAVATGWVPVAPSGIFNPCGQRSVGCLESAVGKTRCVPESEDPDHTAPEGGTDPRVSTPPGGGTTKL